MEDRPRRVRDFVDEVTVGPLLRAEQPLRRLGDGDRVAFLGEDAEVVAGFGESPAGEDGLQLVVVLEAAGLGLEALVESSSAEASLSCSQGRREAERNPAVGAG
jgi:hypothetical protein